MINTLIRISYDGKNYSGFQVQANAPTIQGEIEHALNTLYRQPLRLTGASRTDAGVHALGQAANYDAPFRICAKKIPYALNALLPPDIVVTGAVEVPEDFNARFAAVRKKYSYTIDRALFPQVLKSNYCLHLSENLNLTEIQKAAGLFVGNHDFRSFQAAGSRVADTRRTLYTVELKEYPEEQLLVFYFEGNGFLYRMVRLITGSLIRVGLGSLFLKDIEAALNEGVLHAAGPTAPAHGLCLEKVCYKLPLFDY